jgi:hypothetical protein
MESSGEANRINQLERTCSRVEDVLACEPRGKVLTKDKRELDMFFATRILPSLMDASLTTPPPPFVRRYNVYFQKDPPALPDFLVNPAREIEIPALVVA